MYGTKNRKRGKIHPQYSLDDLFTKNITQNLTSIRKVEGLLKTQEKSNELFHIYSDHNKSYEKDWNDNILFIEYDSKEILNQSHLSLYDIENKLSEKVGLETGLFNIELTPDKKELIIACALYEKFENKIEKSFQLINEFINIDKILTKLGYSYKVNARNLIVENLLRFVLNYCFDKDKSIEVQFNYKNIKGPVFFHSNGKTEIIERITKIVKLNEETLNKNQQHELETTLQKLKEINYKGLFLVYIGSTVIRGEEGKKAEFDGIICTPNNINHTHRELLYLIEAKDGKQSSGNAVKQLEGRLSQNLNEKLNFVVERYQVRDGVAGISMK